MPTNFPFVDTRAATMLRDGLQAAKKAGSSARQIAFRLGYKQPVVLSHMAAGRVQVPLERAIEIAEHVGISASEFLLAALEQREPRVAQMFASNGLDGKSEDDFYWQLRAIARGPLSDLPAERKQILREVVSDMRPAERWLALAEISTVRALRKEFPRFREDGLPGKIVGYGIAIMRGVAGH